jgi:hypothetical protein
MGQSSNPKLAMAGVLAGLGICAGVGWYLFTGTPRYSLMQLRDGIQDNNPEKIDRHFDRKAISTQVVDAAVEKAQEKINSSGNSLLGAFGATFGSGIANTVRPYVEQQIESSLEKILQTASETKDSQESEDAKVKLVSIDRTEDKTAIATFDISSLSYSDKLPSPLISVILKQQPTRQWKIVGLSEETVNNLTSLVDK